MLYKKQVPLLLSVTFTGFNKHTSFLCYGINDSRKKVYDTDPRSVNVTDNSKTYLLTGQFVNFRDSISL